MKRVIVLCLIVLLVAPSGAQTLRGLQQGSFQAGGASGSTGPAGTTFTGPEGTTISTPEAPGDQETGPGAAQQQPAGQQGAQQPSASGAPAAAGGAPTDQEQGGQQAGGAQQQQGGQQGAQQPSASGAPAGGGQQQQNPLAALLQTFATPPRSPLTFYNSDANVTFGLPTNRSQRNAIDIQRVSGRHTQRWYVEPFGQNSWLIHNLFNGRCLSSGADNEGSPIIIDDCDANPRQLWNFAASNSANGGWTVTNQFTGRPIQVGTPNLQSGSQQSGGGSAGDGEASAGGASRLLQQTPTSQAWQIGQDAFWWLLQQQQAIQQAQQGQQGQQAGGQQPSASGAQATAGGEQQPSASEAPAAAGGEQQPSASGAPATADGETAGAGVAAGGQAGGETAGAGIRAGGQGANDAGQGGVVAGGQAGDNAGQVGVTGGGQT